MEGGRKGGREGGRREGGRREGGRKEKNLISIDIKRKRKHIHDPQGNMYLPMSFLPSAAASTSTVQLPSTGLQERMSPLLASHTQRRLVRGLRARAGVRERLERVGVARLLPIELLGTVRGELIEGSWRLSWWSELEESFTIVQ